MTLTEKIQREKLDTLKGQLKYTNDCLMNRINEMEDWEVKEFLSIHSDYKEEVYQLDNHIKQVF